MAKLPASIPVGYVRISTTDPPMRVTARLSDERPNVDSGYGGWEEVARPRKTPLTTFKALPAIRLTLPILLDNWTTGASIEKQISDLELMGRPVASDGEPPQVKIAAPGGAVPYQGRTWVVSEITFGDALMNDQGDRVRQKVNLALLEYVADVYLAERSAANRERAKAAAAKQKAGAAKKRAPVSGGKGGASVAAHGSTGLTGTRPFGSGETLVRIAARDLGDATRWTELADLNGLRDPRAVPFGQVIRLP